MTPANIDKIAASIMGNANDMSPNVPANIAPTAAKPSPMDDIRPRTVDSRCPIFSNAMAIIAERIVNISSPVIINSGNIMKPLVTSVINQAQIPPAIRPQIARVFLPILSDKCPIKGPAIAPPTKNNENPSPVKPEEKPLISLKYRGAILMNATNDMLWSMICLLYKSEYADE